MFGPQRTITVAGRPPRDIVLRQPRECQRLPRRRALLGLLGVVGVLAVATVGVAAIGGGGPIDPLEECEASLGHVGAWSVDTQSWPPGTLCSRGPAAHPRNVFLPIGAGGWTFSAILAFIALSITAATVVPLTGLARLAVRRRRRQSA
jgi:hypothetical protein